MSADTDDGLWYVVAMLDATLVCRHLQNAREEIRAFHARASEGAESNAMALGRGDGG